MIEPYYQSEFGMLFAGSGVTCFPAGKLEAVESGITSLEDEFLAHIILPDGSTGGDFLKPQIELAYKEGKMPSLLIPFKAGKNRG